MHCFTKRFMRKLIVASTAVVLALGVVTGCAQKKPAEKLVVGTNAEFPPFEFINDKGEIDGFDIAFAKEIAKTLNAEIEITNMEFKSLIAALETGQINMIAAGMTVTEDRKKSVDFSDPYYTATIVIIKKADDTTINTGDDLVGKKVAVQEGTTSDFICTDDYEGIDVSRFKKGVDAVMELKNGKCDAVVIDANPAREFVKINPDLTIVEEPIAIEEYAIAVKKGDTKTVDGINTTLKNIKGNNIYSDLIGKYIEEK